MLQNILNTIKVNLKYCYRSKFILILLLVFVVSFLIPTLFESLADFPMSYIMQKLTVFIGLFSELVTFIVFILITNYAIKQRCLKNVLSKPFSLNYWVTSNYLTSLCFLLPILLVAFCLQYYSRSVSSYLGNDPLLLIYIKVFFCILQLLGYYFLVYTITGVWGVALLYLVFNNAFFYNLSNLSHGLSLGVSEGMIHNIAVVFYKLLYFIYCLFPMYGIFSDDSQKAITSDWRQFLAFAAYSMALFVLCHYLGLMVLQRKLSRQKIRY